MGEESLTFTIGSTHVLSVAAFLFLSLVGVFKYLFRKFDGEIKDLKEKVARLTQNSISRAEFDQTIRIVRDEIRQGNTETHRRLDALIYNTEKKAG